MMPSRTIRNTLAVTMLLVLACAAVSMAARYQLPKGSKAKVQFDPNSIVSSAKFEVGDKVPVYLVDPIVMGGVTLVEAGAMGTAVVTVGKRAGKGGKPGALKLSFESINPKGPFVPQELNTIPVAGDTPEYRGKGKKLVSYLFIFGLFIKGSQAEVPAEATFEVTVAENVRFIKKE